MNSFVFVTESTRPIHHPFCLISLTLVILTATVLAVLASMLLPFHCQYRYCVPEPIVIRHISSKWYGKPSIVSSDLLKSGPSFGFCLPKTSHVCVRSCPSPGLVPFITNTWEMVGYFSVKFSRTYTIAALMDGRADGRMNRYRMQFHSHPCLHAQYQY